MSGFLSGKTSLTTVQTADIAADAITLAKLAGGTDGELITWDASGNPAAVGAGTSGHFLKSQGAGSVPVFAADNKGALTFINTTDISDAATYNFTAVSASSYDGYGLFLQNVIPATDAVQMFFRTSTDGGSSYDADASDYGWQANNWGVSQTDGADNQIELVGDAVGAHYKIGSAANEDGVSGWIWVMGPHLTKRTHINWALTIASSDSDYTGVFMSGAGARLESADVDAFQFLFSSGNIESGTVNV